MQSTFRLLFGWTNVELPEFRVLGEFEIGGYAQAVQVLQIGKLIHKNLLTASSPEQDAICINFQLGSDLGGVLLDELDQVVHTESHKDQRAEEKVVEKDETKIVQGQIGETRILFNVGLEAF